MDTVAADQIVQLVRTHAWIPLLAVVVGTIIRVSKNDAAVARIKFYIKPQNRAAWALVWAVALAALDRIAIGGTWYDALAGGLVAGCGAIAAHEVIVNKMRKGRDFGVKKSPPTVWDDDSERPDPSDPPKLPSSWPIVARAFFFVSVGALLTLGCPGAGRVVCPVIDLASNLCPLILIKLPDGTQEPVHRDAIEIAALRARVTRMRAEVLDGGARDGGTE